MPGEIQTQEEMEQNSAPALVINDDDEIVAVEAPEEA